MFHMDRERQTEERTEGQTDMTNISAAFRNFAKASKIYSSIFFRKGTTQKI